MSKWEIIYKDDKTEIITAKLLTNSNLQGIIKFTDETKILKIVSVSNFKSITRVGE